MLQAMRRTFAESLLLLLLAGLLAAGAAWLHPVKPAWKSDEISVETALAAGTTVLWIDARTEREHRAGNIPGSLLLNEDDWDALLPELLNVWEEDRRIVVYCSSSGCQSSRSVARRLKEEVQLPEVQVLRGGWEEWVKKKGQAK